MAVYWFLLLDIAFTHKWLIFTRQFPGRSCSSLTVSISWKFCTIKTRGATSIEQNERTWIRSLFTHKNALRPIPMFFYNLTVFLDHPFPLKRCGHQLLNNKVSGLRYLPFPSAFSPLDHEWLAGIPNILLQFSVSWGFSAVQEKQRRTQRA